MKWELLLADPVRKALKRMPAADRRRVLAALDTMEQDPFSGDVVRLKILFDIEPKQRRVLVHDVLRRTSTTY